MNPTRIAVVYYSATGNVHRIATAFAEGAADAGAEVRLRRAAENAPDAAVDANPAWRAHLDETAGIETVTLDDLEWAEGLAIGTPTRFGAISAQLKAFIDTTSPLWAAGKLAGKAVTCFTGSADTHGGQESTVLSLHQVLCHWGCIIVPPGWVDYEVMHAAGGNPYGISQGQGQAADDPGYAKAVLDAARFQGGRLAEVAGAVAPLQPA